MSFPSPLACVLGLTFLPWPACLLASLLSCLLVRLPVCLLACSPACLIACLLARLLANMPACLLVRVLLAHCSLACFHNGAQGLPEEPQGSPRSFQRPESDPREPPGRPPWIHAVTKRFPRITFWISVRGQSTSCGTTWRVMWDHLARHVGPKSRHVGPFPVGTLILSAP